MDIKEKNKIRNKLINFLSRFSETKKIKTKLTNISGKTGQYDVPDELYTKRTPRKNRILISWKIVKNNKFTIQQLESIRSGVTVEFINNDFFDQENQKNKIFKELKKRLGGDGIVSSIISIRSEDKTSSSAVERNAFNKLTNNLRVTYKGKNVTINKNNFKKFAIKKEAKGNSGNDKWSGFLFVSIQGGQQKTIKSNNGNVTIFNPSCEYANESVSIDLDLVLLYFALFAVNKNSLEKSKKAQYENLLEEIESTLIKIEYNNASFKGNLLSYCKNHPSIKMYPGKLCDPIQTSIIDIKDFEIDDKENSRTLDITHDEAVNKGKYYWDDVQKCILTPARPTNLFWSRHLSNMMQQNFSLHECFDYLDEITKKRNRLLKKD